MSGKSENYGFDKNEGFIGSVDGFNGIIFYLRESNTAGDETREFWFKRVVNENEAYYQELKERGEDLKKIAVNKRIGTRFKNEFTSILRQTKLNESILDIAFCNVNSEGGENNASKKYKEKLDKAHEKIEKIIVLNPLDELRIFTCSDIYEKIKQEWKNKYEIVENPNGVSYNNKQGQENVIKKYFQCQIAHKKVTIFEIYHPSRRGYPLG